MTSAPLPDERVPCVQSPVSQHVKSLNMVDQGILTFAARVKDTHIGRGDRLQVSISLRNESLVDIQRIDFKIQEIVAGDTIASREGNFGEKRTFKENICVHKQQSLHGLYYNAATQMSVSKVLSEPPTQQERDQLYSRIHQELQSDTFVVGLICPDSARDSYKGKLIHVQHQLKIRLMTNTVTDNPSILIPLKIGNPPKTETLRTFVPHRSSALNPSNIRTEGWQQGYSRSDPGPTENPSILSLRNLAPVLPPTPSNRSVAPTIPEEADSEPASQSTSDSPPAEGVNQTVESSQVRNETQRAAATSPPTSTPANHTPSIFLPPAAAPPDPFAQSMPNLPPPSAPPAVIAPLPPASAPPLSFARSAEAIPSAPPAAMAYLPNASAPPASFTQSAEAIPSAPPAAMAYLPTASAPPASFTRSVEAIPSAPSIDQVSMVAPVHTGYEVADVPCITAMPVPADAVDAPITVVEPRLVFLGGGAIQLEGDGAHEHPNQCSIASAPPPAPANLSPSLDLLFAEMLVSVEDFEIIREKLSNQRWKSLFSLISPSDFGSIIAHVNVDFDQPRVAALLAPHLNGGDNNLSCAYAAAAVRSTSAWNRASMAEKLVPSCLDLRENGQLIKNELSEWDRVITEQLFN